MPNTDYKEQKQSGPVLYEDEITLKQLILGVVDFAKEILRRWWVILLCCILMGLFFSRDYLNHVPAYRATLSFMLDEDESGGGSIGGLNELLGGLGGNQGSGLLKIVELFKSRLVIDNAVLQSATINQKSDFLANHFLVEYDKESLIRDFNENLLGNFKDINSFRFVNNDVDNLNLEERMMLKVIYYTIVGHPSIKSTPEVLTTTMDEEAGIMSMTTETTSEDLTLVLGDAIYKNLSNFFISKAIEKQQKLFDITQFKKDSVENALRLAEFKLADFEDKNRKMASYKGLLEKMKLQREKSMLSVMYGSNVKNLEAADFSLRSKTPFVQVIDRPFRPLSPSTVSLPITIIKSVILGTFLAIILIVIRKIIVDALAT